MSYIAPTTLRPANVPDELVVDIDFRNPPGADRDIHLAWKRLHDGPDIVWTPHNGGHWIATRAADIAFMQSNHDPFSVRDVTLPANMKPMRLLPLEADPPEHTEYRKLITQSLSPKVIHGLEDDIRTLSRELIAGFHGRGECEFMSEFARHLPILMFMRLANLASSDRPDLLRWTETNTRPKKPEDMLWAMGKINDYLTKLIEDRRIHPGDDIVSKVVHGSVFGRALDDEELHSMLFTVLSGGLDTVACSMGFFANFLARNPSHRRQLTDRPELIPNAVEELLRRHGISGGARVLTRDCEYKGIHFKRDDRVYVHPVMYGLDERQFDNPLEVNFERQNIAHASFGNGPHRCPGSMLARTELRIFLEEWMQRIPDFGIKAGEAPRFNPGVVNCIDVLPLSWPV